MEVKLDKRYPVAASPEQAWSVLSDIRATAACMPGAAITEQLDDTHFKGTVKSKVGPAVMSFGGDIELLGLDAATKSMQMLGKGADKSGSSASMNLSAQVEPGETAASSVLVGKATIVVSGKLAQFGSRLLVPVSDAMLGQFADNFRKAAAAAVAPEAEAQAEAQAEAVAVAEPLLVPGLPPALGPAPAPAPAPALAPGPGPGPESASEPLAAGDRSAATLGAGTSPAATAPFDSTPPPHAAAPLVRPPLAAPAPFTPAGAPAGAPAGTTARAPASTSTPAPARPAPPAPAPSEPANELNALGLMWTVIKNWFAGLFGKR